MNKDAKERLREYVENDDIYSEYKNGKCDMSDFDKFCIDVNFKFIISNNFKNKITYKVFNKKVYI